MNSFLYADPRGLNEALKYAEGNQMNQAVPTSWYDRLTPQAIERSIQLNEKGGAVDPPVFTDPATYIGGFGTAAAKSYYPAIKAKLSDLVAQGVFKNNFTKSMLSKANDRFAKKGTSNLFEDVVDDIARDSANNIDFRGFRNYIRDALAERQMMNDQANYHYYGQDFERMLKNLGI